MEIPTNEPTAIRAGDSASWTRELPEYSAADGWALKYKILYAVGAAVAFTATGSGTTHTVTLSAAATAAYSAGAATLVAYVEKTATGEKITLETTPIAILPDLSVAANHDGRSANQIALANARAALASYMSKGQMHVAEYDIGGRTMKFRAADEISTLIQRYEQEVFKELAAQASMNGVCAGRVQVRM